MNATDYDEPTRIRIAAEQEDEARETGDRPESTGTITTVGLIGNGGSKPTTNLKFYLLTEVTVSGTEAEGAAGAYGTLSTFYALNLGGTIPPDNTLVICTSVEYRWVFRYD